MATFAEIDAVLARQAIELPSWAFGNSGTRFKVFAQPGVPRDPFEKVADAAQVHLADRSGAVGRAAHPVGPRRRLRQAAPPRRGPRRAARHDQHQHVPGRRLQARQLLPRRRARARQGDRAHAPSASTSWTSTGSRDLKVWLPDGLNYPGQGDLRDRQERLADSLAQVYARLGDNQRLVLEYKFFEPAFYATDVPDWGTVVRAVRRARASGRWCASTPVTTRPARTSSSSSCSCCASVGSARSTSTRASTPTTT